MNHILETTILQLGYADVEFFVKQKLTETLLYSIAKYESKVKSFEHKYNMDFETFEATYITPEVEEDFAKWDDDMDWDAALHSLNAAKKMLLILETEGLTSYGQEVEKTNAVKQRAEAYYKNIEANTDEENNS